jgi:hypothetical protein
MDEYAQIYWLDERNASRDHRPAGGSAPASWRPGAGTLVPPPSAGGLIRYPAQPVMAQPIATGMLVPQAARTYFGGLALGQIIEMATQALAALQPLPAAPVGTKEVVQDVGNLVLYQSALASHAKRDEQLRTLGSLISALVR